MHIKERNMLNPTPIRILGNRPYVRHPNPRAVYFHRLANVTYRENRPARLTVGLEHNPIGNIQIVIHSPVIGTLERPSPLGVPQVSQVDYVRDGDAVGDDAFDFVELVVQQHELVPVALGPPALVRVRGAGVLEAAEHFGVGFVGGVPDGDAVFGSKVRFLFDRWVWSGRVRLTSLRCRRRRCCGRCSGGRGRCRSLLISFSNCGVQGYEFDFMFRFGWNGVG
jgi:hypothetical protein